MGCSPSGQHLSLCQSSSGTLAPRELWGSCPGDSSSPAAELAPAAWRSPSVCTQTTLASTEVWAFLRKPRHKRSYHSGFTRAAAQESSHCWLKGCGFKHTREKDPCRMVQQELNTMERSLPKWMQVSRQKETGQPIK